MAADRPEDKQPLEQVNAKDDAAGQALEKMSAAAREGSAFSGNDKASKLPDCCEKALGLKSAGEVQAYVDGLQMQGKAVLPEVDKRGREAGLNASEQQQLTKTVAESMTREQNIHELNRSLGNIGRLTGATFENSNLGQLGKEGAESLMTAMRKAVEDFGKKAE